MEASKVGHRRPHFLLVLLQTATESPSWVEGGKVIAPFHSLRNRVELPTVPCLRSFIYSRVRQFFSNVFFSGVSQSMDWRLTTRTLLHSSSIGSSVMRSCFPSITTNQIGSRWPTGDSKQSLCLCSSSSTGNSFMGLSLDALRFTISRGRCY